MPSTRKSLRNRSGYSLNRTKGKEIFEFTRPSSITPAEAVTFLEESSTFMTEDWAKSLLYKNIKNACSPLLPLTVQEMTVLSKKPPREPNAIVNLLEKGITILKSLLLELLGTKEDMERFSERYSTISPGHARALMEKCLSLFVVRNLTADVLKDIIERENIIKSLEVSNNRVKEKVVQVYRLNKVIRLKIQEWVADKSVPFNRFVFGGMDYLQKISEDSVILQGYMASPFILYTQN